MNDLPGTITAIATLVASAAAALIALKNNQRANEAKVSAIEAKASAVIASSDAAAAKIAAEESRAEIVATKDGVFELGRQLDGRLQELIRSQTELARAQGRIEGRAAERAEPTYLKPEAPTKGGT